MEKKICCICGKEFLEFGNNPEPVKPYENEDGSINTCCDQCNYKVVIPARLREAGYNEKELSYFG